MKNPKVGAILIILILVLAALAPVAWKQLNREAKAETDDKQPEKTECKGGPSDLTHGDVIAIAPDAVYPKKGEMATFEGYVAMPNLTYLNGGTYMVKLCADSTLEGADITLLIKEGDCENTMVPTSLRISHSPASPATTAKVPT